MRYKKEIFRILPMLLAVMFFWCGSALAVDVARNLSAGTVAGNVGTDVLVPITVGDATDIGGIAFTIGYNPQAFTFKGLEQDQKPLADGSLGDAGYTADQKKSSLFYQVNDEKDLSNPPKPIGRILVAAATAQGLAGANQILFNARFTINQVPGGVYPIALMKTIISNASAGYTIPQPIEVFVSATTPDGTGKYTSTDFKTISANLVAGSINVTAQGYKISGKVYYGAGTTVPAVGCNVTLKRMAMGGFVFDAQQLVAADGSYSFANKPTGEYQVFVQSKDPGFMGSGNFSVSVGSADVTNPDVNLPAVAVTLQRYEGTVSTFYPGMQLQVFEGTNVTPIMVLPVTPSGAQGAWATGLLDPSKSYKFYVVFGTQKTEVTPGPNTLSWTVQKISGKVTGLPADAMMTVMVGSVTAKVQKMLRKPAGSDGSYEFTDLIPANDYLVSMAGAGKPLTYYIMTTDITLATKVDITAGDRTDVNFDFGVTDTTGKVSGMLTEGTTAIPSIAVYAFETTTFALTQAITDATGAYTFKLDPGTYELFVIKDNGKIFYYKPGAATQNETETVPVVVATGVNLTDKNMDVAECTNTLGGAVTFKMAGGDPAANILITAFSDTNSSRAVSMTGQDGAYTLTGLCSATYTVVMQPLLGRYGVQKQTATVPATTTLNFVIDSGNVLSGTVQDESAANVDNAMIYLLDQATGTLVNNRMFFSTAGKYEIGDVASGVYTLKGNHPDYNAYTKSDLGISADTTQNITFTKGGRFTGTVTDASDSNKPLADVLVIVTGTEAIPLSVMTNKLGKYDVYGLNTSSAYTIIVQKKDYIRQIKPSQTPATGNGTTVDFALAKPATATLFALSGTVSKSVGGAVANAWVMVSATVSSVPFFASTQTDQNGAYSFAKLPQASDYRFVVMPGGSLPFINESIDWSTASGTVTKDVLITVNDASKISGTVTRVGSGVISVSLYKEDNTFVAATLADGNGAYSFEGLTAGKYKVLAISPGNGPRWYSATGAVATVGAATAVDAGTIGVNITLTAL